MVRPPQARRYRARETGFENRDGAMADVQWYYARNDQQFGPVSAAELKQLADAGKLSPNDLLWREGMDAWTTAINLRGLFSEEPPLGTTKVVVSAGLSEGDLRAPLAPARARLASERGPDAPLRSMVRTTQAILWTLCVLVVLAGMILFTRAFLRAENASQEASAGAVYSTFFIAAYVLARSGEKLSRLLLAISRRRAR
jgi:GYF domain 2